MDSRLQEMLDHYEITRTLKEYCHGCDRADEGRMASAYLEDSWDDHGRLKAPGPEFSRLTIQSLLANTDSVSHLLGQSQIEVDGDTAGAETYFIAVVRNTLDGKDMVNQLGGRYVDRLERVDGRWLIKNRMVLRDWSIALPIEHQFIGAMSLTPGQRSNDDHSFAVLGLVHGGQSQVAS